MYYVCCGCVCVFVCVCVCRLCSSVFLSLLSLLLLSPHSTVYDLELRRRLSRCVSARLCVLYVWVLYVCVCKRDAFECICPRICVLICRCRKSASVFSCIVCSSIPSIYVYAVGRSVDVCTPCNVLYCIVQYRTPYRHVVQYALYRFKAYIRIQSHTMVSIKPDSNTFKVNTHTHTPYHLHAQIPASQPASFSMTAV